MDPYELHTVWVSSVVMYLKCFNAIFHVLHIPRIVWVNQKTSNVFHFIPKQNGYNRWHEWSTHILRKWKSNSLWHLPLFWVFGRCVLYEIFDRNVLHYSIASYRLHNIAAQRFVKSLNWFLNSMMGPLICCVCVCVILTLYLAKHSLTFCFNDIVVIYCLSWNRIIK